MGSSKYICRRYGHVIIAVLNIIAVWNYKMFGKLSIHVLSNRFNPQGTMSPLPKKKPH